MTRNLDRRVEVMFPIEQPEPKARVLHALRAMLRDTVMSRRLAPDGAYHRVTVPGEEPFRVQQALQEEAHRAVALAGDAAGVSFRPEQRAPR